MSELIKILVNSLPEAIGGLIAAAIFALLDEFNTCGINSNYVACLVRQIESQTI